MFGQSWSVVREIDCHCNDPNRNYRQPEEATSPLAAGDDERSPSQIQHKKDSTDGENVKRPDVWFSCHRMQSRFPLLWYYPTVRSRDHISDCTNKIEHEQDYAPSLCRKVQTIQSF